MNGLNDLIDKKVALIDRGFVLHEGRVVYPTTVGKLVGATDKFLYVQLAENEDPALFFIDALRCIREAPEQPKQEET